MKRPISLSLSLYIYIFKNRVINKDLYIKYSALAIVLLGVNNYCLLPMPMPIPVQSRPICEGRGAVRPRGRGAVRRRAPQRRPSTWGVAVPGPGPGP